MMAFHDSHINSRVAVCPSFEMRDLRIRVHIVTVQGCGIAGALIAEALSTEALMMKRGLLMH